MVSVTLGSGRQWELGEKVGSGGVGQVYLATSSSEERVIKLVPKGPGILRELLVANDLHSVPNVVPVLDAGQTDTHWALLMPKADMSLRQYLGKPSKRLAEIEAISILTDIARALDALANVPTAEGTGVVHRDLKPDNVLRLNGSWCLTDFGIARYSTKATGPDTQRYFMTHDYAAPEQWTGDTATAQTDIYAFGVIAFEVLMGSRPFTGSNLREQHLRANAPEMTGVSPRLATIIMECLYKNPGVRPTPAGLVRRLENQTKAAPISPGLTALQRANLAQVARQDEEARRKQKEKEAEEERATLRGVANQQLRSISRALRSTIINNAPKCVRTKRENGWHLGLSEASIRFLGTTSQLPISANNNSLPFDVIATCSLAVGRYDSSHQYFGRAHSLWFCDAQEEGRYLWFETAFSKVMPAGYRPDSDAHNYLWIVTKEQRARRQLRSAWDDGDDSNSLITGSYAPFAVDPIVESALSHYESSRRQCYEVAWPLTPLVVGELDEFIDRWSNWLAEAAEDNLPHLSDTTMPEAQEDWPTLPIEANLPAPDRIELLNVPDEVRIGYTPPSEYEVGIDDPPPTEYELRIANSQRRPHEIFMGQTRQVAHDPNFWGTQSNTKRPEPVADAAHGEVLDILNEIDGALGGVQDGIALAIAVAQHLPLSERRRVHRELWARLDVRPSVLTLKHLSDRKNRPIGTSRMAARLAPLRFLDGTRYNEIVCPCGANPQLAMVERRKPSGDQRGELYAAFVVVAAEPAAFSNGTPSRSLQAWLEGQQEMPGPHS